MGRLNVKAGVVGLTTALRLAEAGYENVLVFTKHMPVDSDAVYKSPWADINCVPYVASAVTPRAQLITFVKVSVESPIQVQ
jgi:2-polyprenyl-6-methoxyphenol hydroxylase-like FAD-dependent oxidoreductase